MNSPMSRLIVPIAAGVFLVAAGAIAMLAMTRATPVPPASPAAAIAPAVAAPARTLLGKNAPSREWFGLTVGASTEADVQKWLTDRGIDCPEEPNAKHLTQHWNCGHGLDNVTFEGRPAHGPLFNVFFARTDDGPLHYITVTRRYSITQDALTDYNALVTAITAQLGEPTKAAPAPAHLDGDPKMLRYGTTWNYDDLDVQVTAMRAMVDYVAVSEVWSVPGVEPGPLRPHSPFDGKPNPHIVAGQPANQPEGDDK